MECRKVGVHYETPYFHPRPTILEWNCQEQRAIGSQYEIEEAIHSSESNLLRFSLVLHTNFQLFGNKRKEQSYVHQVIDPPWTKFLVVPLAAWVRLNRLCTGVGRFWSRLHKSGMAASAACESGAEDQTIHNVVFQCPIERPFHGLDGLTVLGDETIDFLLCTCPEILCGQAVDWKNWLKQWWWSSLCWHNVYIPI